MSEIQLQLKKSLDKMTAKELRDLVVNQLPMIQGASGMDKAQIIAEIKTALGATEESSGTSPYKAQILASKAKARELRKTKAEAADITRAAKTLLRRKINKLKKRSRRLAKAA